MKYVKELEVNNDYEIIVVGGGPAGVAAAVASAREGAKTLLIESTFTLGGMGTIGLVPAWCPFSDREKIIYRGIAERILTETKRGMRLVNQDAIDGVPIDPEVLKRVYDNIVMEYGVEVLFQTTLVDVVRVDNKVDSIIVSNKKGLVCYKAKYFVDCTGDADLIYFAGGKYEKGDEVSGKLQPTTLCFSFANVNRQAMLKAEELHGFNVNSPIHQMVEDPRFKHIPDGHVCHGVIEQGVIGFNAGHVFDVDSTDPKQVSKAIIEGRLIAKDMLDALKIYQPEVYKDAVLINTASALGVRESRRIVGEYSLTVDDYADRAVFADEIGRGSYMIDVHGSKRAREHKGKYEHYGKGESYGIPFRCLIPVELENVLVAGRSISTERMVQGSTRIMPACLVTGEAAGLAVAMAKDLNDIRNLDVNELRNKLKEYGAYFK